VRYSFLVFARQECFFLFPTLLILCFRDLEKKKKNPANPKYYASIWVRDE